MAKRPNLPEPASIQEILNKILKPAERRQLEFQTRLRQVWEESVSPALREQTELVDFKRKTLYVAVSDNPWIQELHFLKPRILAAMQSRLGANAVQDIKFRLR